MLALYGRPSTWEWLLFFHILSAVVLVAAALAVSIASLVALRAVDERGTFFRQTAFRINVFGVLPAFVAAIIIGGALADEEFPGDDTPGWLDAGGSITFFGGIIGGILFSILQYWALRRARAGAHRTWQSQVVSYGTPVILAALFVVLFLMAAKPGETIPGPA